MSVAHDGSGSAFAVALASVIRGARQRCNLTIADVALRTGLVTDVVELIESGDVVPHFCDVERIARTYGHTGAAGFLRGAWAREDLAEMLRVR